MPLVFLGNTAIGVLICDRFSAYKKLAKLITGIILAFCWAHFRRDFINAGKKYKELESWANEWLDRIANIYHLNKVRLECIDDPIQFKQAQIDLEKAIDDFKKKIDEEAADESLHPYQKKVLKSAIGHWEGLTVFVKYPEVPIDNNEAERNIRTIAIQRKNFLGSHA